MNENYGLSAQAQTSERTAETVALEIRTLKRQAQGVVLGYAIEIGRRLTEAKTMVPHGEWGAWLKREVEYSQSTAQNLMLVFREYGDEQQSFFGAGPKSQTFGNLTYTKALRLLSIADEEERERFAEEHDVENMSVRELNEALKARDAALEEAAAAREDAKDIRREVNQLQEKLTDQERIFKVKLANAEAEADRARTQLRSAEAEPAQEAIDKAVAEAIEKANAAHTAELDKLRASEEKKRKALEKKAADAEKSAKAAEEKAAEAGKDAAGESDALRAEADKLKAEAASLRRELAMSGEATVTFKLYFAAWQKDYANMTDALEKTDEETAGRLRAAINAQIEGWSNGYTKNRLAGDGCDEEET